MAETGSQQYSLFSFEEHPEVEEPDLRGDSDSKYSDFVVYVDESGDHGLQKVDENYPIFVLAFCVFYKRHYSERVVPALQKFKFNRFGHDIVILHERDIRKEQGPFRFIDEISRKAFLNELTDIIEISNFILLSCVIDKRHLAAGDRSSENAYHIALAFCLETLYEFVGEKGQTGKKTHVVFECRGAKEDKDLELEFRRVCDGANKYQIPLPFDIILADKRANSAGLQLADLVARPVGMSLLRPDQTNRAFEVLKRKFFCSGGRANVGTGYEDWGLKIFPQIKSEKPR